MKQPGTDKKFIFNEMIDKAFIFSLYEDDFDYIVEVFGSCLTSIDEDIVFLTQAFESGDASLVKKSVHKLKPVFGFTGLLVHQDAIGNFENACMNVSSIDLLKEEYKQVLMQIQEGRNIIEQETQSLREFTGTTV
jgi:hypothetical protein